MKLKSLLVLSASLLSLTIAVQVHAAEPKAGKDYTIYAPPQPTEAAPGKIEVTEFFWYGCPHCNEFEPSLQAWTKALPKDVTFRRVPAIFRPQWVPGAKAYYSFEALGLTDKLHAELFNAIHVQRMNPADDQAIINWVGSKGGDAAKFADIYKSFTVQSQVQRAAQIVSAHGLQGVPALVINGKYLIATMDHGRQLEVANYLIAKERAALSKK